MKLVIFDIDGTLTQTSEVDAKCFEGILAAKGITAYDSDFQSCPHVSDTGIARHLYQSRFARDPHDHEEASLCDHLIELLEEQHALDASQFAEVEGAGKMLVQLFERDDWVTAMATGCWRSSAEMKLRAAKIPLHQKPAGFAEDGPSRESIVSAAIARAREHYNRENFSRIVSVGDGVWDVKTAANLGLPFVGIGSDDRAETLSNLGAKHIVADYRNTDHFFACLDEAVIPNAER